MIIIEQAVKDDVFGAALSGGAALAGNAAQRGKVVGYDCWGHPIMPYGWKTIAQISAEISSKYPVPVQGAPLAVDIVGEERDSRGVGPSIRRVLCCIWPSRAHNTWRVPPVVVDYSALAGSKPGNYRKYLIGDWRVIVTCRTNASWCVCSGLEIGARLIGSQRETIITSTR